MLRKGITAGVAGGGIVAGCFAGPNSAAWDGGDRSGGSLAADPGGGNAIVPLRNLFKMRPWVTMSRGRDPGGYSTLTWGIVGAFCRIVRAGAGAVRGKAGTLCTGDSLGIIIDGESL
jgi:hypothetical protein